MIIKRIIVAAASGASIISLAFSSNISNYIRIPIAVFGVLAIMFLIWAETKNDRINEIVCKNDEEIKESMKKIITTNGQICIMSRDLTWVDEDIEACLAKKGDSALIFAEHESELTRRLCSRGVNFQYYKKLGFVPKTRFTAVRYNRNNPQVAIANTQNSVKRGGSTLHTIYQTQSPGDKKDDWINSLAIDMISLCKLVFEESNDGNKEETHNKNKDSSGVGQHS